MMEKFFKSKNTVFALFILFHLVFFNINQAEWGDSYRILRGSEYIRRFDYPQDEKRPPLYSILLATRPGFIDPIMYGKLVMLFVSISSFMVFNKLVSHYIKEDKYRNLALILFTFNPVFFYWSLRIYADVFFTLIVMLSFYGFLKLKDWRGASMVGLLAGLSVLTRFEGYLLGFSLGLAYLYRKDLKNFFSYGLGALAVVIPFFVWRNPLSSSYFEEPSGRAYDLRMLFTYVVSLLFIFGFTSAFYFIAQRLKSEKIRLGESVGIVVFVILELLLILAWPAAVPRLFVPVIPFLIIYLVGGIKLYFDSDKKTHLTPLLGLTTLLLGYVLFQYFLKLQFLVVMKETFAIVILINVAALFYIWKKNFRYFVFFTILSMLAWSGSSVWIHKDNMRAVKASSEFASQNLYGNIGYNDISSVSDWYLNQDPASSQVKGIYYNYDKRQDLDLDKLKKQNLDYIILSNEHNTDMTLDWQSRSYLQLVRDFTYKVGGKTFFAYILRIEPSN